MNNANTIPGSSHAPVPASDDVTGGGSGDHHHIHADLHIRPVRETAVHGEHPANDIMRSVGRVGIIGANSIGIGIARGVLNADIPVTVFDKRDTLDQGLALLRSAYETSVQSGTLAEDKRDRRLALFSATVKFHHLKDCDLIIEVMHIEAEVREKFFRWLDEIGKPSAVLVANVSGASLDRVARFTRRPTDVLGLHFSGPDDLSESPGLVRGRDTSRETYATAAGLLAEIGIIKAS